MSVGKRKQAKDEGFLFYNFVSEKEALGLSKKSIQNYEETYMRFTREIGKRICKESINEWIHKMLSNQMNPISINFYIVQIRVFANWLIENGYCEPFSIKKIKTQEPQIKTIPDEDIAILLTKPCVKDSFVTYRTWVIINFILGTGARASTITNIKIADLDFYNKEIRYTHLKNKNIAIVPMSSSLERVLKLYIQIWDIGETFLFPEKNGGQLTVDALVHSLRKYCIQKGLKPIGAHSFRHTFAKKYILNGGNVFVLQKMLTHNDLTMTKKYVRIFDTDLKTGFENLCPLDSYCNSGIIKKRVGYMNHGNKKTNTYK